MKRVSIAANKISPTVEKYTHLNLEVADRVHVK